MSETTTIPSLTTAEFHAAVHDLNPAIAVFDCDGTLWSGDAGSGFMTYTVEVGLLSREAIDWLDARYRLYKRGEVSELAICGEMVQVYAGLAESEVARPPATSSEPASSATSSPPCASSSRRCNDAKWMSGAVSSTNNWVIEEGMLRFSIPPNRILSARVSVLNGIVTNTLLDVPTDEGKVAALARAGITHPDAVFGNSVHDAAMLAIARRAFPVNPTPALAERSLREGWPVYRPV